MAAHVDVYSTPGVKPANVLMRAVRTRGRHSRHRAYGSAERSPYFDSVWPIPLL